jgi:DNA (cytosine-5)-methyltransferase 1
MRYLSVCSGIEAATVAWHGLGWEPAGFSEIEPFPSAVLAHHYPDTPNLGDMTRYGEWNIGPVGLLVGGTPCQSFSVAGLRKGLADPRGNLALVYCGILDRFRPQWFLWENVPGVLSSNRGRDFGSFLGALAELGYGFAYRVLDAQFFGVAQRRRRVFVVGHFGDWRRAAAVLFERESLRRDTAPSREKRKVAPTIPSRSSAGGGLGTDFDCDGGLIQHCGRCKRFFPKYRCNSPEECDCPKCQGMCECYSAPASIYCIKGAAIGRKPEAGPQHGEVLQDICYTQNCVDQHAVAYPVTHSLRGEGFDVSEDGTGRGTPLVPVGVTLHGTDGTAKVASFTELSSSLRARIPSGVENSTTTAVMQPVVGFNARQDPDSWADRTGPLDTNGSTQAVAMRESGQGYWMQDDIAGTLRAEGEDRPSRPSHVIQQQAMQVRRLTPVECERLQGFPDGYTEIPWRKKPATECPDGPRYKALGNSMAVPVMAWIGKRISMVQSLITKEYA